MNRTLSGLHRVLAIALVATLPLFSQQANSSNASATWGGVTSAIPGPISVAHTGSTITYQVDGGANLPYMLVNAPAGTTTPGIPLGANTVDLSLNAGYSFLLDGCFGTSWFDSQSHTNSLGSSSWSIPISANGNWGGMATILCDPSSPSGFYASAASNVNVTYGLSLAFTPVDCQWAAIGLQFGSVTFYNNSYSEVFVFDDGVIEFGHNQGGVVPAPAFSNAPRVAGLMTDLIGGIFGTQVGRMLWRETPLGFTLDVIDYHEGTANGLCGGNSVVPQSRNTFSIAYSYGNGRWTLSYPFGLQTATNVQIGIRPSGGPSVPNLVAGITNPGLFANCGPATVSAGPPLAAILFNNATPPSAPGGCSLSFTPTIFSASAGIAQSYTMP